MLEHEASVDIFNTSHTSVRSDEAAKRLRIRVAANEPMLELSV